MQNNQYRPLQQTVLISSNESPISADHPLFYAKQKNYFLQQLSNKVAVQTKFNQIDLKRNIRVDHLISRYSKINQDIQKEERKRKMFLSSNDFVPIVGISQQQKQVKQAEKLRQQLYQSFIENCQTHEIPQKDNYFSQNFEEFQLIKQNQTQGNFTVLSDYRSDPNRQKELYLLDLEIAKLKQEEKLQKLVKKKHNECQNNEFLSKVSNTILSSYLVYFEQIFAALIDQILQEEVVYFNSLEAQFYMSGRQQISNNSAKNRGKTSNEQQKKAKNQYKQTKKLEADVKAVKMMQLVQCLDELADY